MVGASEEYLFAGRKFLAFYLVGKLNREQPATEKRRAFYVAGVMLDCVGGKLLRLESAKAPSPGMPKGSQPLGAVSFPSFLYRSKESLSKSLYKRFPQTSF